MWWRILLEIGPEDIGIYEEAIIGPDEGGAGEGLDPLTLIGDCIELTWDWPS